MKVVLDVSAAMQILFKNEAAERYSKQLETASLIIVPSLYIAELSNTLWKYVRAKMLTRDEANQYMNDGLELINEFIDSKDLWQEALAEGIVQNHSVYDMYYMVTARQYDAILISNDKVLIKISKKAHIRYLG